jgi:gluconate 2-dehydrogenase
MDKVNGQRPAVLVTRAIFPDILSRLATHFEVDSNQQDEEWDAVELAARLAGKFGVLTTAGDRLTATLIQQCPELKICANMAVGYNNFDLDAMSAAGIYGTNTPDVLTEATADFGFALLMATARRITESERFLRSGSWNRWRYDLFSGADVYGTTLGIIGMGRIGQAIARRAYAGFSMRVIYHNRSRLSAEIEGHLGARYLSKSELLSSADHVMLVLPYSAQAHHTIGAAELALMKPTAILVNVSRGGLVDDEALADALHAGRIAAAGLDVFENEPQVHPRLLTASNVVLTPHIASATTPTRHAMAQLAADNLIAMHLCGKPLNPLNRIGV